MKRGFEHRLWGYKVVKIKQPDAERGLASGSTSSDLSPSPTVSLDDQRTSEYGVVESSAEGDAAQDEEGYDREKGEYSRFGNVEPMRRPVPESREGREETEEREGVGEWQIPETVILTSESISPF